LFTQDNAGFDYKIHEAMDDDVSKNYSNQYGNTVAQLADTTKMTLWTDA
jgi:carbonic anhydrase